jgi:hypothetical protein
MASVPRGPQPGARNQGGARDDGPPMRMGSRVRSVAPAGGRSLDGPEGAVSGERPCSPPYLRPPQRETLARMRDAK